MTQRILIVEDEVKLAGLMRDYLAQEGYEVSMLHRGDEVEAWVRAHPTDLVLLDLMLPVMNGYDVCRRIREKDRRVPVLMLSAKGAEIDKVLGLELGADDYVTKPFGVRELLARVHAALRRQELAPPAAPAANDTFYFGSALIDRKRFTATRDSQPVELTARELHLLETFHRHKGEVLSRDALLNAVWGVDYLGTTRTLDQHVAQVRKKVGDASARFIKTIHGVGYQYVG